MSRQETVLSVFVASPSDVDEERNRLEDIIRDLNIAWSRELGLRLELIRWETHAYPGFASDAQAVINAQIPNDYDIFIGIMWYRFGTPTGRAGSGTQEEFNRAKARFDSDPTSVQLMIYFKDTPAPVAPSKLDYSQLAQVADFRSNLGKEGGLYWPFNTMDDFENLVRLHLTRHVQAWRNKQGLAKTQSTNNLAAISTPGSLQPVAEEDDVGFLDLMDQFENNFESVTEIALRIATATEEIGQKMTERAAETAAFHKGPEASNRAAAKRVVNKAATDMEQFVFRMDAEIPLFSRHLKAGMQAMAKAAECVVDFNVKDEDLTQLQDNHRSVKGFRETIGSAKAQISNFRDSVASLPRMTTALNRAKRSVVTVLQRLIDEFSNAQVMAGEAEASFASMIKTP
jgi:hypothetical protein